ncbi:hypothetical protein BU17DRAFT_97520 [Hysterangium stoloniferum]|nr:hypothetical protein BU17DRAFT_97520 [Hysterangium stoloniferum]
MDDQTLGEGSKSVPVEQAHSQEKVVAVKDLVADANMFMNYSLVGPSLPPGRQTKEQRGMEILQKVVLEQAETADILGNDHVTVPTKEPSMTAWCEVGKSDSMGSHFVERMGNHEVDAFIGRASKGQMFGIGLASATSSAKSIVSTSLHLISSDDIDSLKRYNAIASDQIICHPVLIHLWGPGCYALGSSCEKALWFTLFVTELSPDYPDAITNFITISAYTSRN